MGNRAVITFMNHATSPCIYLHWNGGRASVEGFLGAAKDLGMMPSNFNHESEFLDKFAELIATRFFNCTVGMTVYRERFGSADTDNYDNGVFLIDSKLNIIGRMFKRSKDEIDPKKTNDIRESIVKAATEAAA